MHPKVDPPPGPQGTKVVSRGSAVATVHIAIPVQDELEYLPACLDALRRQEGVRFVTWLCVNQPEAW